MFSFKAFIHTLLLFTVPFLTAYPTADISAETILAYQSSLDSSQTSAHDPLLSYDNILWLVNALESGELEKLYGDEVVERLKPFLALLAKEGVLSNEASEENLLESDIEELLYGDAHTLAFAPFSGQREFLPCKSWAKKQWDQTRKFVHKHKKAIIIGAVVVVVVGAVVCAVVVAGSAAGATAAAGSAAGAMGGSPDDEKNEYDAPSSSPSSPALSAESTEAPTFKKVLEEQIISFKESIVEDELLAAHFEENPQGDFARNAVSRLAHETLDVIADLSSVVPQFMDGVNQASHLVADEFEKLCGFSLLPNQEDFQENDQFGLISQTSATERHEQFFAAGHEKIDELVSTSLASDYTPEAKANDPYKEFDLGILPPPGMFLQSAKEITAAQKILQANEQAVLLVDAAYFSRLSEAGKALDRGGLTKAGRALAKHGGRPESVFPRPAGNPAQINEHGQQILDSILNHPERQVIFREFDPYGKMIDIHAPDIGGVRYTVDGKLIGFLEPKK